LGVYRYLTDIWREAANHIHPAQDSVDLLVLVDTVKNLITKLSPWSAVLEKLTVFFTF
jgi:hypothetical protein